MPFLCLPVPQAPTSHGPNLVRTSWQGSLGTVVCRQTIHAQGGIRPGSEQMRARETPPGFYLATPPPPHASRSGPHFKVQLQPSSHHELVPAQPGSQSFRPHSSGPGPLGPCGVRAGSPLSTLPHPRQQLSRPLSQLSKAPQCPSALNSPSALISKKISPPPPATKIPRTFLGGVSVPTAQRERTKESQAHPCETARAQPDLGGRGRWEHRGLTASRSLRMHS